MAKLSGCKEYKKFELGEELSPKEAIKAQCYQCNGFEEGSNDDCKGNSCVLYPYFKKWMM